MKTCCSCRITKSHSDFHKDRTKKDGFDPRCKLCARERHIKDRRKNPIYHWAKSTLARHRKYIEVSAPLQSVYQLALKSKNCPICGRALDWSIGKRVIKRDSPTLDRIDNEKHICVGNIQIICCRCNRAKGDMTMEEFLQYCERVYLQAKGLL